MVQKKKSAGPACPVKSFEGAVASCRHAGAETPRPPRAYEPEVALARALDVFWKEGFAATSLDDLSAATGMNRPSFYGAFGDKRELYIKSYERYRDRARQRMGEAFAVDLPVREMLERIYAIALDMYLSGKDGPRGCFTVMTATSEAVFDPSIRALVISGLVARTTSSRASSSGRRSAARFPPRPGRTCWRCSRPVPSTPSRSAPASRCRARNSRPSSMAHST